MMGDAVCDGEVRGDVELWRQGTAGADERVQIIVTGSEYAASEGRVDKKSAMRCAFVRGRKVRVAETKALIFRIKQGGGLPIKPRIIKISRKASFQW